MTTVTKEPEYYLPTYPGGAYFNITRKASYD